MTASVAGFRCLTISPRAEESPLGQQLVAAFLTNGSKVVRCGEEDLDSSASAGALICGYLPPRGWVERAEHGTLAVRSHEYYLNPIIGCRARCTYCFLQASSLRMPLRVYVGVSSLFAEIRVLLASLPRSVDPLLCTGEYADSLADSNIYPVGALLVEEVARRSRGVLELRTKSSAVDSLIGLDHRNRTVVAFSLSPQEAVTAYEGGTASTADRLAAARRCQNDGYRVALKLEPLHLGSAWRERYRQLISQTVEILDPSGIAHVSVGSLRAGSTLRHRSAFRRHHGDALRHGETVAYRAFASNTMPPRSDRLGAYRYIKELLLEEGVSSPIWWSMETPETIVALNSDAAALSAAVPGA